MFGQFETPVLGLVENMSYFICPNCHTQHDLFGHGGAQSLAGASGIPFLGEIPLEPQARAGADRGEPAVLQPGSPVGAALQDVAAKIWSHLQNPRSIPAHQSKRIEKAKVA